MDVCGGQGWLCRGEGIIHLEAKMTFVFMGFFPAVSVCAEAGDGIWMTSSNQDADVSVSRCGVIQRAADLCHVLQYEFIFKPVSKHVLQ